VKDLESGTLKEDSNIKVSIDTMLRVYEDKNGSKLPQILKSLPR
jgi:hypothetical protein